MLGRESRVARLGLSPIHRMERCSFYGRSSSFPLAAFAADIGHAQANDDVGDEYKGCKLG